MISEHITPQEVIRHDIRLNSPQDVIRHDIRLNSPQEVIRHDIGTYYTTRSYKA